MLELVKKLFPNALSALDVGEHVHPHGPYANTCAKGRAELESVARTLRHIGNTRTQQGECKHLDDGMCGNVADDKICCYSPKKEG